MKLPYLKFTLTFFILLRFSTIWALEPAPKNEIACSADIFFGAPTLPVDGMQPFIFNLAPNSETQTWSRQIEKLSIQNRYEKFFSPFWIAPDKIFPFPHKAIVSHAPIENGDIQFTLARFAQTDNRKAGLSLEYNVRRGFYGAYFLDPANDGPVKKIQAPIKFDEGFGTLAVDCVIH